MKSNIQVAAIVLAMLVVVVGVTVLVLRARWRAEDECNATGGIYVMGTRGYQCFHVKP